MHVRAGANKDGVCLERNTTICTPINIINTNATSLCNKIDSLIDCFEELDVTL